MPTSKLISATATFTQHIKDGEVKHTSHKVERNKDHQAQDDKPSGIAYFELISLVSEFIQNNAGTKAYQITISDREGRTYVMDAKSLFARAMSLVGDGISTVKLLDSNVLELIGDQGSVTTVTPLIND